MNDEFPMNDELDISLEELEAEWAKALDERQPKYHYNTKVLPREVLLFARFARNKRPPYYWNVILEEIKDRWGISVHIKTLQKQIEERLED